MSSSKKLQKVKKPAPAPGVVSAKDVYVEQPKSTALTETPASEKTVTKKGYLNNKDLLAEVIESKRLDRLTPKAQEMLYLLGNNVIKKKRYYYNPDDRKDCLQTGLHDMFSNWNNFDPEKSTNAFAYFTEIFKRGMARGFNQLNKKKGDPNNESRTISINSSNDGEGIFNI